MRRPRLIPQFLTSLRARLVLAFAAIVTLALLLVLASIPRLLDGYFVQQAQADLQTRAGAVQVFIGQRLFQAQASGVGAPEPILQPTEPLSVSPAVAEALGTPDDGFIRLLAERVAEANITITIAPDRDRAQEVVFRMDVALPDDFYTDGREREPYSSAPVTLDVPDLFHTQAGAGAPNRLVSVQLSNPFTYRAQTLETIVGVMIIAAVTALLVAVFLSVLFADRLTKPIRQLTGAARELSEGNLDVRVNPTGAPEIADLTAGFNAMAERLQASIEFIRRDRDRGRDFLADVSHELRTPIAALRTFNELLAEGAVDEATREEFLDQSRQQIDRLDWLATNLLELSKLDSGLVLLDLRPDDLRAVVENAVQQAQPAADRKGVQLVVNVPAEPVRQRHDPQRLGQVLSNLIGNALKFTPPNGRVEVELEATDTGAQLRIADTGVGIDPDELPYVFERFYRGSKANESRAAGSGLGLSIVRSIVEMHNGRVAITSTPAQGTQVSILLPRDMSVSSPAPVRA